MDAKDYSKEHYRVMSGENSAKKSAKRMTREELENCYVEEKVKAAEFSQGFLTLAKYFPKQDDGYCFVDTWKTRLKISLDFDTDFFILYNFEDLRKNHQNSL